ncbi:TrmH family RNA methyltransferase [Methylomagnum ishizawai]|uniref:TrmH family RNA methyltransferase n=1 Tax=Methylomagnum ishizawai TaxID=1760988 RepID=UPI000A146446|nr:RNA methyltransferase [Methylomagnum ishizawai]
MEAPPDGPAQERTLKIAGLPAVAALFKREPERVLRLFYEDRMVPKVGDFCAYLARSHRPYRLVDGEELARVAGTVLHGGIVAVVEPRPLVEPDPEAVRTWAGAGESLFILDGVGNPHNLGAIARSLAFLGFRHLLISDHPAQAGLSEAAYRVAEGGLEYLSIHRVPRLPLWLKRIGREYRVVGTALARGGVPVEALRGDDPRPVALVLGNEEDGLPPATLEACEAIVTLRGSGAVQSLNVAATAAILAYVLRTAPKPPTTGPARAPRKTPPPGRPSRPAIRRTKKDPL